MQREKLVERLSGIATDGQVLLMLGGISCVLGVGSIVVWLAGAQWLGFLLILTSLLPLAVILASRRLYLNSVSSEATRALLASLKKLGIQAFTVEAALGDIPVPRKALKEACVAVYEGCLRQALKDMVVTERERAALDDLSRKLAISPEEARRIEGHLKHGLYQREVEERLADGEITKRESMQLQEMRSALGLTDAEALRLTKGSVTDAYRALFRRFAADGKLTAGEVRQLRDFASATALSADEAARISRRDAVDLYRRTVAMVCQDGIVTDDETNSLDVLEEVLHLRPEDIGPLRRQVDRTRMLGNIRAGDLPRVSPGDYTLQSTELCHWRSACEYEYQTRTQTKSMHGEIIVTDRRFIFLSAQRSFEVPVKRVINVKARSDAVVLQLTTTRGQGGYYVRDADLLSAVFDALVRRQNFVRAERLDDERTRHIPDHVKVAVWQRDGGKCVRCGASDYLEFDHIIPFSKGGANSERNIQLLCRRCNLAKGGELV